MVARNNPTPDIAAAPAFLPGAGRPLRSISTRHRVVLASRSPRRSAILDSSGFTFTVQPANIEESLFHEAGPEALAGSIANAKSSLVQSSNPGACVISADTVVDLEGQALGKPADESDAIQMLRLLSGRSHRVHTAVSVLTPGTQACRVETTVVHMRLLSTAEISSYVSSGKAADRAGSYGIQDAELDPVSSVDGSYLNVVGLPLALLANLLFDAGEISREDADWLREREGA